jgi:hypothetical protein
MGRLGSELESDTKTPIPNELTDPIREDIQLGFRHAEFDIRIQRSVFSRHDLRQELYAVTPLVRICAGAVSDGRPYRNRAWACTAQTNAGNIHTASLE